MRASESIKEIAAALLKAQCAIGAAKKSATNPHFKSRYADLPAVIEAVKPALNAEGIVFLQPVSGDSTGVTVTTRLQHVSGEWMEETLFIPVSVANPQAYGSAISYARRYSLQSFTGLPADDDDGNAASEGRQQAYLVANTAKQVAVDAFELLPADEQKFLRDLAAEVDQRFKDGLEIGWWLETKHLENEEKLGLWSILPSNVRSQIKKDKANKKEAA